MFERITSTILSALLLTTLTMSITACGSGTTSETTSVTGITAKTASQSAPAAQFVADELLIQLAAGVSKEKSDEIINGHGAQVVDENKALRIKRIKVPAQALLQVKEALSHNPLVNFVEVNSLAQGEATPNDPSFASQWHLPKISAPQGWDITTGANTVPIAIVDSGVDPNHPDLAGKLLPGYSFLTNTTDTHDVYGHGTKVAGSAAAAANNSLGVSGVAWQNPVMPLVVLDSTNYASYFNIGQAITYAADHGVRVINVSIGGTSASSTLENAVNYAWNKGALVFVAAGNSGVSTPEYPAGCTKSIAVAATDSADNRASFSQYGTWIKLSAPGVSILTTTNGSGYGSVSGTSFSSPIAAGVAALILSVNPNLSNQQVLDIMTQNADDLGTAGFDQYFGYGRVNAAKSLQAALTAVPVSDTTAPSIAITSPTQSALVKGTVAINVNATDNVAVVRTELFINGSMIASDNVAPFGFSWDTTTSADGIFTIETRAYDAAGNVGRATVSVTVNNTVDTTPPTVTITDPSNGGSIAGMNKITIKAAAMDNLSVSRIELSIDGSLVTNVAGNSLSYSWNLRNIASGSHTVSAKAFDTAGNSAVTAITLNR